MIPAFFYSAQLVFQETRKIAMVSTDDKPRMPKRRIPFIFAMTFLGLFSGQLLLVAGERLEYPMPPTATNGAIHYQRAILFLYAVDPNKRTALLKPIWEIMTPDSNSDEIAKIDKLLIESRHAIRSALVGANQTEADFGLDLRQYMVAALLPHVQPMVDLAKLNTLHGMERESKGKWKEAADIYFATLRMGRHMTRQTTLAETVAGVEMLETGYYALGHWAPHCPDATLVGEAFDLLSAMSGSMVNPARTLRLEASIFQMRLDAMQDAFPEGPWAEMILESLGEEFFLADPEEMREAAIKAATTRGVPKEAFQEKESFSRYMTELRSIFVQMANESAQCMCHRSPESIQQGKRVFAKYQSKLLKAGDTHARNPAETAALFAVHEAELTLTRLILAISAARTAEGFPAELEDVADRFGGQLPRSPYDETSLVYELLEEGKGFSLRVKEAVVGDVKLPEIKFKHLPGKLEVAP